MTAAISETASQTSERLSANRRLEVAVLRQQLREARKETAKAKKEIERLQDQAKAEALLRSPAPAQQSPKREHLTGVGAIRVPVLKVWNFFIAMLSPRSVSREIYAKQMRGSGLLGNNEDLQKPSMTSSNPDSPPPLPKYEGQPAEATKRPPGCSQVSSTDSPPSANVGDTRVLVPAPSPFKKLILPEGAPGEPQRTGRSHVGPYSARL
ncbi:Kinesin-like protein kip2, partial [Perkinsus olseni]